MADDDTYCWCGTRMTFAWAASETGGHQAWHCSAHGYQDRPYGPTPDLTTLPHA